MNDPQEKFLLSFEKLEIMTLEDDLELKPFHFFSACSVILLDFYIDLYT